MVQFNLLPDVKIEYIRAKRQKYLVTLASVVTIVASVTILVLLILFVFVAQKKNISDLSRDIDAASEELQSTPDLEKMLTVQNQLRVLPDLHGDKAVASRLFKYISQSTPAAASISRLEADFEGTKMSISGSADSLEMVNTFVDTLKFATYSTKNSPNDQIQAFSGVVLSSFGRDSQGASYTINLNFDPVIFSDSEEVTLTVPNRVTTRSQIEQPSALFQETEAEE